MSENNSPLHIILSSESLTQAQVDEINRLTRELGESISAHLNSGDVSYVFKDRLPRDAKVADLMLMAGQIAIEIAPTLVNHVTPWILAKIDETIKGISARKGSPVRARVLVGNREENITPKTTEAEIDTATERIRIFNESAGDRFALVIGNSNYQDQSLPKLNSPAHDAQRLADLLRNPNIGAFSSVQLLVDKDKTEIEETIEDFYANKQRDDLLLFYYSGHGIKPHSGKNELLLTARNTTSARRRATSISESFLTATMKDSHSDRQIIILDCCFGAAIVESSKSDIAIGQKVDSKSVFESIGHGRIFITATDETQYATDGKIVNGNIQNSLFTTHLIEGLEGGYADKNNDGRVDIHELYDYVLSRVGRQQTPVMDAHLQGEIIIGINPNRKVQPAQLPDEITRAMASQDYVQKLGAITSLGMYLENNRHDKAVKEAVKKALDHLARNDYDRRVNQKAEEMAQMMFGSVTAETLPQPKTIPPQTKSPTPMPIPSPPAPKTQIPPPQSPPSPRTVRNSNRKIFFILISILVLLCLCSYVTSTL